MQKRNLSKILFLYFSKIKLNLPEKINPSISGDMISKISGEMISAIGGETMSTIGCDLRLIGLVVLILGLSDLVVFVSR